MKRLIIMMGIIVLFLAGCSSAPPDTSALQKAVQTLQASNQQQTKDIQDIKAALASANTANNNLTKQLASYPTRDELTKAMASIVPPVNITDVLSRVSSLEGSLLNLKSVITILQSQVTTSNQGQQSALIASLANQYATKTDIAILQGQLNTLGAPVTANVTAMQNTLAAQMVTAQQLITNLGNYGAQLQLLQSQVGTLINTTGQYGSQFGAINSAISALQTAQSSGGAPAALITAIQSQVATDAANVAAMQSQVNMLQGNITLLQGQVATLIGQVTDIQNRLISHGW